MKSCRDFTDLFMEMHENRADAAARQHFAEHMRACPACREDFKWYGVTVNALNSLERVQPPHQFMVQLGARLDKLDSPSLFDYFRTFFSPGSAIPVPVGVTALLAIAVTGLLLYNQSVSTFFPWVDYQYAAPKAEISRSTTAPIPAAGRTEPQTKGLQTYGLASATDPATSSPPSTPIRTSLAQNTVAASETNVPGSFVPTLADTIGADNLTVESASIPTAVETVKRILPNLRGRLVEMKPLNGTQEVLMGLTIPSQAYGELTRSLINQGAVQAGAGVDVTPPKEVTAADGQQVFLYIRIQKPR